MPPYLYSRCSALLLVRILGAFVDGLLERRWRFGVVDLAAPADLPLAISLAIVALAGLRAVFLVIFAAQPSRGFRFLGAFAIGRSFRRRGLAARSARRLADEARTSAGRTVAGRVVLVL